MNSVVLDCSVAISWFMSDETSTISNNILTEVTKTGAVVPSIWPLELGNVLLVSQRRKRLTKEQMHSALHALRELPIKIDSLTYKYAWQEAIELAERYNLSLYDACYLELALRYTMPLATFDKELKRAAELSGIKVLT